MKNIFNLLVVCALFVSNSVRSQELQSAAGQSDNGVSKLQYVNSGAYLAKNTAAFSRSMGGDSLNGFNESAIVKDLKSRFTIQTEFYAVLGFAKRDYINKKY